MKKLLVIVFMICWGCETVVDPDIETGNPSLVLNGVINPDSVMRVQISENWPVLAERQLKIIEGATVNIYEEDKYLGQLEYDDLGLYTNSDLMPKRGVNYRIEVSKKGYESIIGEAMIPQRSALISEIKIDTTIDQGLKKLKFEVEIDDPVGEDYYEFMIWGYRRIYEFDQDNQQQLVDSIFIPVWLETEDLVIDDFQRESGNFSYVFNDNFFEGKKYSLSVNPLIGVYDDYLSNLWTTLIIVLKKVNKDYYLYQRSGALQSWIEGDPFAEPVLVHNNIQNGFGIFAGYNQIEQVVIIK